MSTNTQKITFFRIWIFLMMFSAQLFGADAILDIIRSKKTPTLYTTYVPNQYLAQSLRVYKVLLGDLLVSGHFIVVDGKKNPDVQTLVEQRSSDLTLEISLSNSNNSMNVNLKVSDSKTQNLLLNKIYVMEDQKLYPFVAHKIAIDVNNLIQAPKIDWMNRYVVFSSYTSPGKTNLYVADYTLTYRKLIKSSGINLFPKWANSSQSEIYYTHITAKGEAAIIRYNIYTGKSEVILSSPGMAVVSSVSKDAKKLLVSLAPSGEPDIYLYEVDSKKLSKMTKYTGIDVSGNFVNEDKSMVFVSDRLGSPNIFFKDLNPNSPIEQVVFYGKNNVSVSSFGDYVAYSSKESDNEFGLNTFNLYLISTKSDYIRRLTTNGINQLPRFSSDGGSIMFIKTIKNQSALGVIRLEYNKTFLFPFRGSQIQGFDW